MRGLRTLLVPALFGLALLIAALITRTGILARKNPGEPINSAMREAMGQASLPPRDAEQVAQRFPNAIVTPSGLRYRVDRPGQGGPMPQRGQFVSVHYRGELLDGTPFDDSYSRGEGPFNFPVGIGRVVPGWDEALMTMTKGEKRTLIVPYWLAYGEKGQRGRIPPRATLVFEVELVDLH